MAEVGFILTIPYFLKRFGIKTVMLMSMLAWTLRFGFFAFGDPSPFGFVLLLMSMIVYGCAFDFFNISGSVFVEQEVSSNIRASAQGLFMTMVNGVGAWVGSILSGMAVDYFLSMASRIGKLSGWCLPRMRWLWRLSLHCSLSTSMSLNDWHRNHRHINTPLAAGSDTRRFIFCEAMW